MSNYTNQEQSNANRKEWYNNLNYTSCDVRDFMLRRANQTFEEFTEVVEYDIKSSDDTLSSVNLIQKFNNCDKLQYRDILRIQFEGKHEPNFTFTLSKNGSVIVNLNAAYLNAFNTFDEYICYDEYIHLDNISVKGFSGKITFYVSKKALYIDAIKEEQEKLLLNRSYDVKALQFYKYNIRSSKYNDKVNFVLIDNKDNIDNIQIKDASGYLYNSYNEHDLNREWSELSNKTRPSNAAVINLTGLSDPSVLIYVNNKLLSYERSYFNTVNVILLCDGSYCVRYSS